MRMDWLAGAAFAATALGLYAADQTATTGQPAPTASVGDKSVAAPAKPTAVPFTLQDNLVVLDAVINGSRHPAVLDSSASFIIVDKGFAQTIGAMEGEAAGDAAGGGSQAQQLRAISVRNLTVGPLRFADLQGYAVNLAQLSASAGFPVNFLIGAPAFQQGAVTVDYRRRRVTFGPSGSAPRCRVPIPLAIVENVPVVEAEIRTTPDAAPIKLKLAVDLGTRHQAVMIGGPFVRSEAGRALAGSGTPKNVGHGIGGEMQGSVARVATLRLGALVVENVEAALSSGSPAFEAGVIDGTLGVPLWRTGVITFDYQAKTLCIER